MLPKADARLMGDGFNATLYHAHSETDAHSVVFHEHGKERSRIEKRLFQNLTYQHDFNDLNRPLKLVLSHQVGWSDLNLPMVSLNFFLAFVSIYILFSYLQSSRKRQLQMIEYQKQLIELAGHDHLTGLPNRHLLIDRLEQAFALSKRSGKYGALIFVDLNKFKLLNDTHGHLVGDLLLKSIASRLTDAVREIDTVARLGGDEFVVVANELSEDSAKAELAAHEIGSKLREMIEQPHQLGQLSYSSSASLGVSLFLGDQWTVDQVLAKADSEMYQEKRAGK
jgi:diguanylate cyclase (GGDEF)-like protein